MINNSTRKISASLMCLDPYSYRDDLGQLEKYVSYLHIDIMDGSFVPNIGLGLDFIKQIRRHTTKPFDYHLMVENPIKIINQIQIQENDIVSIHFESTYYLEETFNLVKSYGAKLFIAINPLTPISILKKYYHYIDGVNFMTVNPGFAGQKMVDTTIEKAIRLMKFLQEKDLDSIEIEVDGNMNTTNISLFKNIGATIFVLGTSSIFPNNILDVNTLKEIARNIESNEISA